MFMEPEGDQEIDDSEFPTLEEAVLMSRGIKTSLGSGKTMRNYDIMSCTIIVAMSINIIKENHMSTIQ